MGRQKKVVDAKADSQGRTTHVKLSGNKSWTPVETAMRMTERNEIANTHVSHTGSGTPYLRTNPDGKKGNNLDEMSED